MESASGGGVTLLPSGTVEELLSNKRRHDLVQPFKLGLLKLASQEAARLLASGQYELALPVVMNAVTQGPHTSVFFLKIKLNVFLDTLIPKKKR